MVRQRKKAYRLLPLGSGIFIISLFLAQVGHALAATPSFFNTVETVSNNMQPFTKWNGAVDRYTKEKALQKKGDCSASVMNKCHYETWTKFLLSIKDKDPLEQLKLINANLNQAKYITDPVNWGQKDYWATPFEFMAKFGDCEDYAIAKYMSLRRLGWKNEQLRVVAVKDLNLKIGHAILVVYIDGKVYVLDNQIKQVVEAEKIRHYRPIFSINQDSWWRHRAQ